MKIICDSILDIPNELIEKYDIEIVPLTIIVGDKEYLDRVDITTDEFYKILEKSDILPKTSQVTYARFKETFDKYTVKGENILYISGSSSASGTYQSAVMASKDTEGEGKVYTFDTSNLSIGGALFVIKACELKDNGLKVEEIISELENLKGKETIFFSVDNLEYLQKGGRISGIKATMGSLLQIKPILTVKDGLVVQHSKARGKKQIISSLINSTIDKTIDINDKTVVLGCCINTKEMEDLKVKLLEIGSPKNIYTVDIGACVSSHSGPTVLGIAIL